jgi:hypothetical protein
VIQRSGFARFRLVKGQHLPIFRSVVGDQCPNLRKLDHSISLWPTLPENMRASHGIVWNLLGWLLE